MPKGQKKGDNVVKIQVEAKNPRKRKRKSRRRAPKVSSGVPKELIDNFVGLQKVQTHLVEKLDSLSKQVSELVRLFEKTAKTFAENPALMTSEYDKEFMAKINQLLEQDKAIAKGVTYIEERMDELEGALEHPAGHPSETRAPAIGTYQASKPGEPKPLPKP